jgi:hypothetical protein
MQKALRNYERNLKKAKETQKQELKNLELLLEQERTSQEASATAREVMKETLKIELEG